MKIHEFLTVVTSYIRSKEAKGYVEKELLQHLQQGKYAWMEKGYSAQEAEQKAVEEMGSPITLGQKMNNIHKLKIDWLLIGLLLLACVLSFLPLLALSKDIYIHYNIQSMLLKNGVMVAVGILVAIGCMYIDYRKLQTKGYVFYGIAIASTLAFPLLTNRIVNGEMMIQVGIIVIQAWMVLPLFIIAWAGIFSLPTIKLWKAVVLFILSLFCYISIAPLPVIFLYIILVSVLFLQSSFSRKTKWIVSLTGFLLGAMNIVYIIYAYTTGTIKDYQIIRLLAYLQRERYEQHSYYYRMLEDIIDGAQWFGASNTPHLPEGHTDFVLAHVIQSYGYALAILIVAILVVIIVRFILISVRIKNSFGKLLIVGGITLFTTQFVYHIFMTFGLVPITSMALPFISYGLMSTLLGAIAVGLALSVYRRQHIVMG